MRHISLSFVVTKSITPATVERLLTIADLHGRLLVILLFFVAFLKSSSGVAQVGGTIVRDENANGPYQRIPTWGTYTDNEPGVARLAIVAPTTAGLFTTTTIALPQAISFVL